MFSQFITNNGEDLYSVYHEPEVMDHCDTGVVFCYPYGQEYIRCHKLYVNMANKLARRGFHALRFDYYGTGDSSGDFNEVTVQESLNNTRMVIDQFRDSCGVGRIVLFGVRFGASLAMMYSGTHPVDALVLWNPVLDGRSYLKSIDLSYKNWLNGSFTREKGKNDSSMENFGFQFSARLVQEIGGISLGKEVLNSAIPTLFFGETDEVANTNNDTPRLLYERSVTREYWIKQENELDKAMVPGYETGKTIEWLDNLIF
jgi:uncharacterized protein